MSVMRLLCALGRHRPSSRVIPNEGRLYSRCPTCESDIILVGQIWRTAPRGYRVIWKDAPAPEPSPPEAEPKKAASKRSGTKRRRTERRTSTKRSLPAKLGGKDRRRTGNRRKGFGKKPDTDE